MTFLVAAGRTLTRRTSDISAHTTESRRSSKASTGTSFKDDVQECSSIQAEALAAEDPGSGLPPPLCIFLPSTVHPVQYSIRANQDLEASKPENTETANWTSTLVELLAAGGFCSVYLFLLLAAVLGSAPRGLVLALCSLLVPTSPGLTSFEELWAPCTDPTNLFTACSASGTLFKVILVSDHAFRYLGLTAVYVGMLRLMGTHVATTTNTSCRFIVAFFTFISIVHCLGAIGLIFVQHTHEPSFQKFVSAYQIRSQHGIDLFVLTGIQ